MMPLQAKDNQAERRCIRCGVVSLNVNFGVPGYRFNFLDGSPFVCEKCVATVFGVDGQWRQDIAAYLEERRPVTEWA